MYVKMFEGLMFYEINPIGLLLVWFFSSKCTNNPFRTFCFSGSVSFVYPLRDVAKPALWIQTLRCCTHSDSSIYLDFLNETFRFS